MASHRVKKSPKLAIVIISGLLACITIIFIVYENSGDSAKPVILNPSDDNVPPPTPEKLPDTKPNGDKDVGPSTDGNKHEPNEDTTEDDDTKSDPTPTPKPAPPGPSDPEKDDDADIPVILIELINRKDLKTIISILDYKPTLVTEVITEGKHLIHLAVLESYTDLVKELVNRGCDVNASSDEFMQIKPLHLATRFEPTNLLEFLIEKGAEIDATDVNGETPLFNAVLCDRLDSAKYLLDRGADPNLLISPKEPVSDVKDGDPLNGPINIKTMLNVAISMRHSDMVNLLLSYHAAPELSDSLGMNALHAAAFYGRADILDTLLAIGTLDANAKMPDSSIFSGKTGLEIAEATGHLTTAKQLKGSE